MRNVRAESEFARSRVLVNQHDGQDDVEVVTWASSTETQSRRSVYGETIDELLELTDYDPSPDEVHYAHADKLGSIMLMVTSGGAIEESYRYKEYGETTVVDNTFAKLGNLGSNINNWKRYTGRERMIGGSVSDPWYHYRARAYRADAGRFVQEDILRSNNRYAYVDNRPMEFTDPTGRQAWLGFIYPSPALPPGTSPASPPTHYPPLTPGDEGGILALSIDSSCGTTGADIIATAKDYAKDLGLTGCVSLSCEDLGNDGDPTNDTDCGYSSPPHGEGNRTSGCHKVVINKGSGGYPMGREGVATTGCGGQSINCTIAHELGHAVYWQEHQSDFTEAGTNQWADTAEDLLNPESANCYTPLSQM